MTAPALNLTPARRRALEVLAATHPRAARYSNLTAIPEAPAVGLVYWQSADWLLLAGLIERLPRTEDRDGDRLALTAAGIAACHDAGIEVGS